MFDWSSFWLINAVTRISFFPSISVICPPNVLFWLALTTSSSWGPAITIAVTDGAVPDTSNSFFSASASAKGEVTVRPVIRDCGEGVGLTPGGVFPNEKRGSLIEIDGNPLTIFGPNKNVPVITNPIPKPMSVANSASLFILGVTVDRFWDVA